VVLERFQDGKSEGAVEITDRHGIEKALPPSRIWSEKVSQGSNTDTPSSRTYMKISLHSEKSEVRHLFLYKKDNSRYIEEPRSGIYKADSFCQERIHDLWRDTLYVRVFGGMMATGKFVLPKNSTGKNKAAALFKDRDGNETGYFHMLPEKMKAASPADARYLVYGAYGKVSIGKYNKLGDDRLDPFVKRAAAYRITESVSIYDLSSGRTIAEKLLPEAIRRRKSMDRIGTGWGMAPRTDRPPGAREAKFNIFMTARSKKLQKFFLRALRGQSF
jgi:hypothetical protein